MTFFTALMEFQNKLKAEYGIDMPLIKLGLHPEMYVRAMEELYSSGGSYERMSIEKLCEPEFYGIKLVPRTKDKF